MSNACALCTQTYRVPHVVQRDFVLPFGFRWISQRTSECCIISPLLLVIFFSDVIDKLEKVQLEAGTVMLGPLAVFAILFADDLVLLARTIKDLQALINAFAKFCDKSQQHVAVDKIEEMIFQNCDCNDHECVLFSQR